MNSYNDLVAGKSLDELLKEAKQLDMKGEMILANVEKKERTGNYENGLIAIMEQGLAPQKYEVLFDILQGISNIEGLLYARGDISIVLKNLVKLEGLLEPIELSTRKLKVFMRNIREKYVEAGTAY